LITTTIAQNSKKTIKSKSEEASKSEETGDGKLGMENSSKQRGRGTSKNKE